jgi:flagellar biosynthesis/type III secretory pathway chaperone
MNTKNIIDYLKRTISSFTELNLVYASKQKLLIEYNYEDFSQLTKKEEIVLSKLQHEEKNRLKLKDELLTALNLPKEKFKMEKFSTILTQRLKNENFDEIIALEEELKSLLEKSSSLNRTNLFLLEHKKQFVTEMFRILFAGQNQNFINRKM